ncbi:MAG: hypothetical protein LBR97_10630 [Dysgonamonadaceae bacterium]|jgi:hypothetical protein|nr:hypothetical protein [Dysgonamonadaceae bacterium]
MEERTVTTTAAIMYVIMLMIGLGIGLLIPYFLCHIDPNINAGWLRGFWHGSNFIGNLILSLFDGRLLKAPVHTAAYNFFWWFFTISSCLMWLGFCINMIKGLGKILSGEYAQ